MKPSNNRDWCDSLSQMPEVVIQEDQVTIYNLRDFHYRSENDYDIRYISRTYDMRKLQGVDLAMCYWGSPLIAHMMLSFDFGEDGRVVLSSEVRKEKGEKFENIAGLFRKYEILFILGTEEDLFKLRTNYRNPIEDLYVYKTIINHNEAKIIFTDVAARINKLRVEPQFYNVIRYNCMFSLFPTFKLLTPNLKWRTEWILNGLLDEVGFNNNTFEHRKNETFQEYKKRCYANPKVINIKPSDNYSDMIRK